jgi:hypothetical protein
MLSKRKAVDYSGSDVGSVGKPFQMNGHPYLNRTGDAGCTSSKVYKDYLARLEKRKKRVQADEGYGNLARDSSATAHFRSIWGYAQSQTSELDDPRNQY